MTDYEPVRGYRVVGERKPDRELSMQYIQLKAPAAHAHQQLREAVRIKGANCVGREDFFSGETLPSDRDAALACASCPVYDLCKKYAELAHPAWGVHHGVVYGRNLEALENEE